MFDIKNFQKDDRWSFTIFTLDYNLGKISDLEYYDKLLECCWNASAPHKSSIQKKMADWLELRIFGERHDMRDIPRIVFGGYMKSH